MSSETVTGSLFLDQVIVGLIVLAVGSIGAVIYKNRDKLRKNNDFSSTLLKNKKLNSEKSFHDKFENSKPEPSVRENMRSIRKMLSVFDSRPLVYNKRLFCGCLAKDKLIVKLCQSDRQRYIVMMYDPPEGYYISEDIIF